MRLWEEKDKRKGLIGTVVFHAILLLVFLFTGLTIPVPMPEEEGLPVQLDLGNTDFGSGDEQPQSTSEPEVTKPITEPQPTEATPSEPVEEVATQDAASDYAVPEEQEEAKPVEKKPELDKRLKKVLESNPFKTKADNESTGEGSTDQAGDFGKPDGSPDGSSLEGDAAGGGISYNLSGNMQETGRIVLEIIVDRRGNVVRVTPGGRGTTITNADLIKKAIESARRAKFTPKADAPEEQKGTMTYEFILE